MALDLTIVTPEGERFHGDVERVVLPGAEGDFGVLPGHERFLSALRIGEVDVSDGASERYAAVSGGFAEVSGDRVVVLVETCEFAEDIDAARAERARKRAEAEIERLQRSEAEGHVARLQHLALDRAVVRISVASRR